MGLMADRSEGAVGAWVPDRAPENSSGGLREVGHGEITAGTGYGRNTLRKLPLYVLMGVRDRETRPQKFTA